MATAIWLAIGAIGIGSNLGVATAADYLVEAAVFVWPTETTSEYWYVRGRETLDEPSAARAPAANTPTATSTSLLTDAVARLQQNTGARLIRHLAWTQDRASRRGSPQMVFNARSETGGLELSGWIRLYESNLLYTEIDLMLVDPTAVVQVPGASDPNANYDSGVVVTTDENGNVSFSNRGPDDPVDTRNRSATTSGARYRITERRRVKFNEIHYIDHPKFGVLISVQRATGS